MGLLDTWGIRKTLDRNKDSQVVLEKVVTGGNWRSIKIEIDC